MNPSSQSQQPLVGIVIPNYNGTQITCECLNSLQKLDYPNHKIYLVENGSEDRPANLFREKYPHVRVIESPVNLGFAAGSNIGMRQALAEGADYILLLNNDTIAAPDLLSNMFIMIGSDPQGMEILLRCWASGGG